MLKQKKLKPLLGTPEEFTGVVLSFFSTSAPTAAHPTVFTYTYSEMQVSVYIVYQTCVCVYQRHIKLNVIFLQASGRGR